MYARSECARAHATASRNGSSSPSHSKRPVQSALPSGSRSSISESQATATVELVVDAPSAAEAGLLRRIRAEVGRAGALGGADRQRLARVLLREVVQVAVHDAGALAAL